MRRSLVQIYLHCVWGTWNRLPLITNDNEKQVYTSIIQKCHELGVDVLARGGTSDHVHLLVHLPSTVSVAHYIMEAKGSTSHLMTHHVNIDEFFKWQGGYAAFSVSLKDVPRIKSYIEHQQEHHKHRSIDNSLEF